MDFVPVHLDPSAAYQVISARDARFDGRLFVGVTSTGVYCRPICRVRTPRREHCRFFASAAQAEAAAFRPCLKCRPEIAPGPGLPWSVMDAPRTLAVQAAAWLDAHAHDGSDGDAKADAAAPGRWPRGWASASAICGASSPPPTACRRCSTCRRAGCCWPSSC